MDKIIFGSVMILQDNTMPVRSFLLSFGITLLVLALAVMIAAGREAPAAGSMSAVQTYAQGAEREEKQQQEREQEPVKVRRKSFFGE